MSDTGTFDAAINHLTNRLNSRGEGSEREELRQAIRVLEAAGRLTEGREWALDEFDNLVRSAHGGYFPGDKEFHCMRHCRNLIKRFRALLESLPDKEKK